MNTQAHDQQAGLESDRLHPMIALLRIVALSLLNLRELSRRDDARSRPATDVIAVDSVAILSAKMCLNQRLTPTARPGVGFRQNRRLCSGLRQGTASGSVDP